MCSPRYCDIWSLGIILLNIVTGRNPWKCATQEDPTFRAYCRNPYECLSGILPISPEMSDVLVMMLSVEWRARSSIPEIRAALSQVDNFYSMDAIFEGNVARCSWEAGVDLGTGAHPFNSYLGVQSAGQRDDNVSSISNASSTIVNHETHLEGEGDSDICYVPCRVPNPPAPKTSSQNSSRTTSSRINSLFDKPWALRKRPSLSSLVSNLRSVFRLCSSSS